MAHSSWFMSLQCPTLLLINRAIPLLPLHISYIFFFDLNRPTHHLEVSFCPYSSSFRIFFIYRFFFRILYKMAEIVVSLSSDGDEREIDKYQDDSNSSNSSSDSSSDSGSKDERYSSGVPEVPLKVLQEELRQRVASRSSAGPSTSAPTSTPSPSEEDFLYCWAIVIPLEIEEKRLYSFRGKYQIPNELNPRLAAPYEWCYTPNLEVGIYEAYLMGVSGCLLMLLLGRFYIG